MKTFVDYMKEQNTSESDLLTLNESLQSEWTSDLEFKVDSALEQFASTYLKKDGTYDVHQFNNELTNEGILGSIFGGLTGFALGKTIGKTVAKILGIQSGVMYDMLTSRLVGAALGASLGKSL
jgi:hypothetical protein